MAILQNYVRGILIEPGILYEDILTRNVDLWRVFSRVNFVKRVQNMSIDFPSKSQYRMKFYYMVQNQKIQLLLKTGQCSKI